MAEALRLLKALTRTEQVTSFYGRQRRLSHVDPSLGLSRTHRYIIPTATIPAATLPVGVLSRPVSFKTAITITGVTLGTVFEFGDSTSGIAIALDGQNIYVAAGSGIAASDDAAVITYDNGAAWPVGLSLKIFIAVQPGRGAIQLWLNGESVAQQASVNNAFPNGHWSDSTDGAFDAAPNGTMNLNIPVGARVTPSGFGAVEPLSVFVGQTPRFFFNTPAADAFAALIASPHDYGNIGPGSGSGTSFVMPGTGELFVQFTDATLNNGSIDVQFTLPTQTENVAAVQVINTPVSIGTHITSQVVTVDNNVTEGTPRDFEILRDSDLIAFGTCLVL